MKQIGDTSKFHFNVSWTRDQDMEEFSVPYMVQLCSHKKKCITYPIIRVVNLNSIIGVEAQHQMIASMPNPGKEYQ